MLTFFNLETLPMDKYWLMGILLLFSEELVSRCETLTLC